MLESVAGHDQYRTAHSQMQPCRLCAPESPHLTRDTTVTTALRILVVDDNHDIAGAMEALLRLMGNEARAAYDGLEAVELAADYRPDVILCDISLPTLNGYDAARLIREQAWGQNMVLIATTGWGQAGEKQRAFQAGFNHHLVKPVDAATLMEVLATVTRNPAAGPALSGGEPTAE